MLGDWLLHNVVGDDLIRVGLMDPATGSLADVEHSL